MHNFFEAKGRKLNPAMPRTGMGFWGGGSKPLRLPPAARWYGERCKLKAIPVGSGAKLRPLMHFGVF